MYGRVFVLLSHYSCCTGVTQQAMYMRQLAVQVYNKAGLLTSSSIFAHGRQLTEQDM
jgi:hypothetical protein